MESLEVFSAQQGSMWNIFEEWNPPTHQATMVENNHSEPGVMVQSAVHGNGSDVISPTIDSRRPILSYMDPGEDQKEPQNSACSPHPEQFHARIAATWDCSKAWGPIQLNCPKASPEYFHGNMQPSEYVQWIAVTQSF